MSNEITITREEAIDVLIKHLESKGQKAKFDSITIEEHRKGIFGRDYSIGGFNFKVEE